MAPSPDTLVLLSPLDEDHLSLGRFLMSTGFRVHRAHNREEAQTVLRKDRVAVVIAERDLPEGGWKDVLQELKPLANPPLLIVTSRHADDRLWAEVLNLGGHDVLPKPFHAAEVTRVVRLACRRWVDRNQRPKNNGNGGKIRGSDGHLPPEGVLSPGRTE